MIRTKLAGGMLLACLACGLLTSPVRAGWREDNTIESACEVLDDLAGLQVRAIPPSLLQDAHGVAIVPNMVKAGFVVGGRFGRGVMLVREGDAWGKPVFITLTGGSFGWQIGVQATDLVLVFKTRAGVGGSCAAEQGDARRRPGHRRGPVVGRPRPPRTMQLKSKSSRTRAAAACSPGRSKAPPCSWIMRARRSSTARPGRRSSIRASTKWCR